MSAIARLRRRKFIVVLQIWKHRSTPTKKNLWCVARHIKKIDKRGITSGLVHDSSVILFPDFEDNRGIVYKIRCKSCDSVYVGQTSRALKTRVKEHVKPIATLDENSMLAKHHVLHNHETDLENVEIIDRSLTWRQRLFLEAWHSMRDKNSINEHIALPSVYKNINSFQRH